MALAALVLWCCSLFLPVFDMGGNNIWLGGEVLLFGWLGLVVITAGWYANIFFFWSFFRLWMAEKAPVASILLAVLLAFDSFRLTRMSTNGHAHVYGYGWGMLLWFLAIFLLLAAVGKRRQELAGQNENGFEALFPAGLILCSLILSTWLYFAVHDRMIASPSEAERLADIRQIAFKRQTVCSAYYPAVADPIQKLSGSVEIVSAENGDKPGPIKPFDDVGQLLYWGIPAIRFGDTDYSHGDGGTILAAPAVGQPAAILSADRRANDSIVVRLVETKNNRLVFEQAWEKDGKLPKNPNFGQPCVEYI